MKIKNCGSYYLKFIIIVFVYRIIYSSIIIVGSQIVAHTLIETGNGPNKPNTINL